VRDLSIRRHCKDAGIRLGIFPISGVAQKQTRESAVTFQPKTMDIPPGLGGTPGAARPSSHPVPLSARYNISPFGALQHDAT
jgi:hypothetical protein